MKRFYREVSIAPEGDGWRVLLDGRGIKTAGGRPQLVPSAALADALGAEWAAQGEEIDPARFILRDLADYAIDITDPERTSTIPALLRFAQTDTLCYRADPDEPLYPRQIALWEPLLAAAETRWEISFTRISGVIHQPQSAATLRRLEAELTAQRPFDLAALNTLASLAASLVVGLAALEPGADAQTLWAAANLEEDWQAEQWGQDADAQAMREKRLTLFSAAIEFARLSRG